MYSCLIDEKAGPLVFTPGLPVGTEERILPGASILSAVHDFGTAIIQEWKGSHCVLRVLSFKFLRNSVLHYKQPAGGMQSVVQLEGHLTLHTGAQSTDLSAGQYALLQCGEAGTKFVIEENTVCRLWNTYFEMPVIQDFLHLFPKFQKTVSRKKLQSFFLSKARPVQLSVRDAIRQQYAALYEPDFNNKFFEYKIKECLFLKFVHAFTIPNHAALGVKEKKKAREAYDIIIRDIKLHYTNQQLARMVGINHVQLKRAFQQQYGMGMFSLLQQLRFEKAHALLTEGELPIKAIASLVGYDHTTSFITEFRKHFGYTPLDVQKQRNL